LSGKCANISLIDFYQLRLHALEVVHTSRTAPSASRSGSKATRLRWSPAPSSSSATSAVALSSAASYAAEIARRYLLQTWSP
jgi:hypothetical protein